MNWIKTLTAVVATLGLGSVAQAGLFDSCCGTAKSCGCTSTCQPACCKPVIARPCCPSVHTYQRACSNLTPPCCKPNCCGWDPSGCCKKAGDSGCGNGNGCGNNGCAPNCAAPAGCGPRGCAPSCGAPAAACGNNGCAPHCAAPAACAPKCCAPAAAGPNCAAPCGNACGNNGCAPTCAAPAAAGCGNNGCGNTGCGNNANSCCGNSCCKDNSCEIAQLIYKSQTACYAKDRRRALDRLGDRYSCVCNPEIMCAFVYGLNDCDERVRWEAADEIGDQLRKNPCCCSCEIVTALTAALADCDRGVRRQAEEALRACGYKIVDGCCGSKGCGNTGCGNTGCGNGCGSCGAAPMAAPAPAPEAKDAAPAPAPAPPVEPKAYFPTRLNDQQQSKTMKSKLGNLFGLRS